MAVLHDPLNESYLGKVADALTGYSDDLQAKGFDPGSHIQQLTGGGPLIGSASKLRKQSEASLTAAVTNEQSVRTQFYTWPPAP